MRTIVFSDVHSNLVALESALVRMRELSPDAYVCLGDVVGYGANPDECCDMVRDLVRHCIMGNHDAAVSGKMDFGYYYDAARTALSHHIDLVSASNREWLAGLPYAVPMDERTCLSHGSPIDPERFDYILQREQAESLRKRWDELQQVTFIGHSHLTVSFEIPPPEEEEPVREMEAGEITLRPDRKYVVTVGSIGQPRDNDARSCFVVWDQDEDMVRFQRVDYDIAKAAERIFADPKLSVDFGKRLFLGV